MYRPEIDVQNVNAYANKQVAISLCAQRLFIGSNITIEKITNNDHEITILDLIEKPFVSSINEYQYSQMIAGCGGRYVCGDLVTISGEPQDHETKFKCVSPPNRKCIKKAK